MPLPECGVFWPTNRGGKGVDAGVKLTPTIIFSNNENFLSRPFRVWQSNGVRFTVAMVAALLGVGLLAAPPVSAGPTVCDYPACTPGIMAHQVLGAPCDNTTYYAFGTADYYVSFASEPGRLMFCGSPRRYQPRWFRSPPMAGVKDEGADCHEYLNYVAQAPDGLFLVCVGHDGITSWVRGDT